MIRKDASMAGKIMGEETGSRDEEEG